MSFYKGHESMAYFVIYLERLVSERMIIFKGDVPEAGLIISVALVVGIMSGKRLIILNILYDHRA